MTPPAIRTASLGKRFGARDALTSIDLEVPQGCAFGFLGPNGAGKTTLIRLLLGLAQPSTGTIELLGRPMPAQRAAALARVGAIVEEPRFHRHLSGRRNLETFAAARGPEAFGRIDGALARVGLAARADDRVAGYSLGMRQRLGIARCLLADPALLILDEPMNGLDPAGMQELRELIRALVAEGRTVLLSSHLLDEVQRTCDVAAIVDRGRVVASGTIGELLDGGRREIEIGCDAPARAVQALAGLEWVAAIRTVADAVRVVAEPGAPGDRAATTALVGRLLEAGVALDRVVPVQQSLEERFFSLTTPLEATA
jgi:ABC-2 type transport system ATP-binding protein